MRFKVDNNLKKIAAASVAHVEPETVAVELFQRLVDAGMVEDNEDCWGEPILLVMGPRYVSDICAVLAGFLYGDKTHPVESGVFDAFCRLEIINDGPCPECGADYELVDTEGHEVRSGDYDIPNSYVIDYYIYRCRECGKIIKTEEEL